MLEKFRTDLANLIIPKSFNTHDLEESINAVILGRATRPGTQPSIGTSELIRSYSRMPWARSTLYKISQGVGATNWKLFVKRSNDTGEAIRSQKIQRAGHVLRHALINKQIQKGDLEEIEEHPLLTLLATGNPRLMGQTIIQLTQTYVDLVGEAFWILEKNMLGVPVAMWPVPPDWVKEFPTDAHPFYRIVLGANTFDVPITEIIDFIDPDPTNPYNRGSGIMRALSDELETDEFSAKHIKAFFENNARPDIIVSGEGLSRADTIRLEERWLEKHQGFWNRFKPHFINKKINIEKLDQSFRNMDMVNLRKNMRDTIMQVLGLPPEKFGVLSASNRSTISAADFFWTKDVIVPRIELIRNILQDKLVPKFDDRLILDFESPVVQDKEHQLNVMKALPAAFTINEWREDAEKDSLGEDGEFFIMNPGQMVVNVDEISDIPMPEANPPPSDDDDDNDDDTNDDDDEKRFALLLEKYGSEITSRFASEVKRRMAS